MTELNPMATGLVVGIPFNGRPVAPEWAMSLATQNYPLNTSVMFMTLKGTETGEARNRIVEDAIKIKAKYIWFIDDDTAPPSYAIRSLTYALDQQSGELGNAMVCGGIYCSKSDPAAPVVFKEEGMGTFWNWKIGEVFECGGIGTGCMLIKTELFQYLEKPYFKTVDENCDSLKEGSITFKSQLTDDLYFCRKVRDAGFKILAHGGVQCIHWDISTGRAYTLPTDSYPMKELAARTAVATVGTVKD